MMAEDRPAVNFWNSLTPAERQAFTALASERTFARGARLMREGEPANHVMVILSGLTRIGVRESDGERVIAERGPGQLVGERGALRVNVRSATVTALEMVHALVMRTEDFASFVTAYPRVLDIVEGQIYDRLAGEHSERGEGGWPGPFPVQRVSHVLPDGRRQETLAGENCTVILTDVVGFGARNRNDHDRQIVRREGLEMMRASLGSLWGECNAEDRGDGLLIVAPPQVQTSRIMEGLHRVLPGKLRKHNRTYSEPARIRLRVAVNVGPVTGDPIGMSGEAIIRTARLADAPVLKAEMASTGFGLGIIVSTFVYETVIAHDGEFIEAAEYKIVEVRNKEFISPAWMRVIDLTLPRS